MKLDVRAPSRIINSEQLSDQTLRPKFQNYFACAGGSPGEHTLSLSLYIYIFIHTIYLHACVMLAQVCAVRCPRNYELSSKSRSPVLGVEHSEKWHEKKIHPDSVVEGSFPE